LNLLVLLFFCAVFEKQAKGKDYPWSLQYVTNMHTINPAFVGMWDRSGIMASTKTNWVGIKGAPLSQYISYFTPIKEMKSGVALSIQRTNTGLEKRLTLTGDYSYQVRLDMHNYLRFGLRAGIVNFDNNLTDYGLYPDHIPDPEFNNDIRLYNMTTFGVGAVFFNPDFYISLSVPQVISNTLKVNRNIYSTLEDYKTIYLSGSYVFDLVGGIRLRPNLLMATTIGKPLYFDAAALLYLPSNLQMGINLRSTGTVCFSAQYTFKNHVRIGYASDYALISDIRKYQLGTYEILIGLDLNFGKRRSSRPNYF
jgi:type IX secretion system PorP/SprF family membrane protein